MTRTSFMLSLGVALGLFGCSDASTAGDPADTQMSKDVTAGDPAESDALETLEDTAITPSTDIQDVSATGDASPGAQDAAVEDSSALSDGTSSQDAEALEETQLSEDAEALEETQLSEDAEALEDTQLSEDAEALEDTAVSDDIEAPEDTQTSEDAGPQGDACDLEQPSNEGCAFTAVTTANPSLGTLFMDDFAVVLANRTTNPPATVEVTQGGVVVSTGVVSPGETLTLSLPMVSALVEEDTDSLLAPQAAYEIITDVPVTATQFSPLHFQVDESFAMSNDASLLLPHRALTEAYTYVGFPAWAYWVAWRTPFIAVAAIEDDTTVTVTASSVIAGGPLLSEMAPGDTQTITLHAGDVLQLLGWAPEAGVDNQISPETCEGPGWKFAEEGIANVCEAVDLDLTGTTIASSAPVAVFAGHSCLRMPFDAHACDHVEEQLLPTAAWGLEAVVTAPQRPDALGTAPATHRVVARDEGTVVTLSPPIDGPFSLGAGEQAAFTTDQDVRVTGSGPILVVTAMHGAQGLEPPALDGTLPLSDPSIGFVVPLRQAREEYLFLTPDTFQSDWLNIVAFAGSEVLLDDVPVTGWTAVGTTPYVVARVPVTPGPHRAVSQDGQGFTLMSYGHANHTSYLYPGGLNLNP